jgi:predicted 2-oxoglutarate/Fe(II)-dependent dioxygenase YbiX
MGVTVNKNLASNKECEAIASAIMLIKSPSNLAEDDPSTGYYQKLDLLEQDVFAYGVVNDICERVLIVAEDEFGFKLEIDQSALIMVVPGNTTEEHADNQNLDGTPKDGCSNFVLSAVVYLNDDFTGGDLVFPRIDYRYRPSIGDCVVFPSDLIHSHYVDEVLSGNRISLAIWFSRV